MPHVISILPSIRDFERPGSMDSAVAYKFGITKPLQIAPMQDELTKRPVSISVEEDDV